MGDAACQSRSACFKVYRHNTRGWGEPSVAYGGGVCVTVCVCVCPFLFVCMCVSLLMCVCVCT